MEYGLGRLYKSDERDKKYLIRSILPTDIQITHKQWFANGWWGNQGQTPMCVGYSTAHWIEDGPIGHFGVPPIIPPEQIYEEAQKRDGIRLPHEGTTVRAAMDYLLSIDYISEYRWDWTLQGLIDTILTAGPCVVGTNWYTNMFNPDEYYFANIGGRIEGGHAYVIDGVNTVKGFFRMKNSWGRLWGHNGFARITFEDMERLINEDGEISLAIENPI